MGDLINLLDVLLDTLSTVMWAVAVVALVVASGCFLIAVWSKD